MQPSTNSTNASVEQLEKYVGGDGPTSPSDLCDWSKGHILTSVDWPVLLLNDAIIIAGVGLVVWLIIRKRSS
jgi:hypothetical protein